MEYPGPNPDDHDIHNKLTCVEYPGLVKDPDAMLRTMGGIRTISSVFSTSTKERLEINFRPDNIYSKPLAATKHSTTGILLKVRVRKPKAGTSRQAPTAPAVDEVQIVGTVERMYRFENLCDFQYLPIKKIAGRTKYIYDDIMPQGIVKADWLDQNSDVPLFLPPQFFSRVDTVNKGLFKKDSVYDAENPDTMSMIGVKRQRRINHARYVEFNLSAQVPATAKALTYEILKAKMVKKDQFDLVKNLFQQRPIWTRLALLHECKMKNVLVKHILPAIAYYYTTGPWRVCWVRLGYDPRLNFEARYFQTLDYRIRSGALKHDTRTKLVFNHLAESNRARDTDDNSTQENQNYWPIFDATTIPNYRCTFYQYCDIHLPQVQEMLDRLQAPSSGCNERRGWLPMGFDEQCRDILSEIVHENYQNVFKRNLADEQEDAEDQLEESDSENPENIYDDDFEEGEQDMDIDEEC